MMRPIMGRSNGQTKCWQHGSQFCVIGVNRPEEYKKISSTGAVYSITQRDGGGSMVERTYYYIQQETEALTDVKVECVRDGLEGVLKVSGKISKSAFTQFITLAADSRRLEFHTEIDWRELHRLLKAAFPVDV